MAKVTITFDTGHVARLWAKRVHAVNLAARGGYALLGDWLPVDAGEESVLPLSDGDIIVVSFLGGSRRRWKQWVTVLRVASDKHAVVGSKDLGGTMTADNAEALFFLDGGSAARAQSLATEWGYALAQVKKARSNVNYAAALFIDHLCKAQEANEGGDETVRRVLNGNQD